MKKTIHSDSESPSSENIDSFESEKISASDSSWSGRNKNKNAKVEAKMQPFAVESDFESSPKHNIELYPSGQVTPEKLKP